MNKKVSPLTIKPINDFRQCFYSATRVRWELWNIHYSFGFIYVISHRWIPSTTRWNMLKVTSTIPNGINLRRISRSQQRKGKNGNQRNSTYRPGIGGKKVHSGCFSQTNLFFSASAGVSGNLSGEQSRKRRIPVKTDRVAGIELASVGKWAGYFPD